MKIAVLSGKGGTGKTFISVNLATVAEKSIYLDCDVEEPNGHLFLKPQKLSIKEISVKIPNVNQELCTGCRKCVEFCKFNALAYVKDRLIIFDEICHSCGGCTLFCPEKALSEKERVIGTIQKGLSDNVTVLTGILNTGEVSGVPIISEILRDNLINNDLVIIDCPPGSSCMVMEGIKDADYCVLVAEPTIFGVHNLNMVYELVRLFEKPFGIVLNKCLDDDNLVEEFCIHNKVEILARIPFSVELGKMNSNGLIASKQNKKYQEVFINLLNNITKEVCNETIINP
ncbi:MinD superfamily P-loop ATPase [Tissierella praeacuta]|uniref:nucleotide-binding protein n=1 Tax=Tissierella praeacuta TaxID=43131 RepID=UPI0010464A0D|nr:ATP-binding protein [Tissierella praeacuta]TCU71628.1 MinD superfamily P-loop ATPase [Tissierella praeacuta]